MTAAEKKELARLERIDDEAMRRFQVHDDRARRAAERMSETSDAVYRFKKAHGLLRVPMPETVNLARAEDIYRKLYARPK